MLLYSIVSNTSYMTSSVRLAVASYQRFCGVAIRSAPVAVDFSVMLNVAAGEGVSLVSG